MVFNEAGSSATENTATTMFYLMTSMILGIVSEFETLICLFSETTTNAHFPIFYHTV